MGFPTVILKPVSTTVKVSLVAKVLRTFCWVSLFYGVHGRLTNPFPAQFEVSSIDGTNGIILNGEAAGDNSGYPVSLAGDLNGDGFADIVIGASYAAPSSKIEAGKSYGVYGSRALISGGLFELTSLNGANGFIINGDVAGDRSDFSLSSAGDVNGDGLSDIVIGAHEASPSGKLLAGTCIFMVDSSMNRLPEASTSSCMILCNGFSISPILTVQ